MLFSELNSTNHTLFFFFFNDTATTEIYTLSLHDALPISAARRNPSDLLNEHECHSKVAKGSGKLYRDRKSTRLNSSHSQISYAVFCLKKKKIYLLINSQSDQCIQFLSIILY